MADETGIIWTDSTFNAWWGCARVSRACQHCYAETLAKRFGKAVWGKTAPRRLFPHDSKHWREPAKWDREAASWPRPRLVFCSSMADVFEDRRDLDVEREQLWSVIEATPHLRWQLLTKRPQHILDMIPKRWRPGARLPYVRCPWCDGQNLKTCNCLDGFQPAFGRWPANVWIGATVEDQETADERIPHLLRVPAGVRFLSCEPLVGPIDLSRWLAGDRPGIGWIIVGGESGPGFQALDVDHARDLRDQATAAGVPFLFKQHGGIHNHTGGRVLDGRTWEEFPADAAGGPPSWQPPVPVRSPRRK